ncbi:sensor histidine kinase [Cryptosporangium arvum]|uniref:sensor histidine kinase n=1 Tax=Cryptosporangium arvum TaxID=80871 RepID=UPI0012ED1B0F|nr:histidine kinase [Cryptosporangium arvum]
MGHRVAAALLPSAAFAGELLTIPAVHSSALGAAVHVVVAGAAILAAGRWPTVAFVVAVVLASVTGSAYVLLLWTAFRAGRHGRSPLTAVAAVGGLGVPVVVALTEPSLRAITPYLVFVVLPVVAGRYLRQHADLLAALRERNRELRRARELSAERERLRERLRIARDMHDALGHRLGLVSIQAAALEAGDLPVGQRQAITRLAESARDALGELHEVVGALRHGDDLDAPGLDGLDALVEGYVRAGLAASLSRSGPVGRLGPDADRAAYRVVEEGLTNAGKHAPGRPVTVTLDWESDALLLTIVNPVDGVTASGGGHGVAGMRERVEALGGFAELRCVGGEARLSVLLPTEAQDAGPSTGRRAALLGATTAVLLFGVLPAAMLVGAG